AKERSMNRSKSRVGWVAALALGACALSTAAYAESWTNVPVVDVNCSNKVKDDPDAHPRTCALRCASSGYGIWTADGKYLKFDAAGSEKAKALLEASDKKDHLRVDVTGELDGETLQVATIAMSK
ncbi:MAG: hypothetical protein ACREI7_12550, partial [Myxococcota bacterium]